MKILMLSWEYPPISFGGLARHVEDLSEALVNLGHDVYIVTQGDKDTPEIEEDKGIKIFRTAPVQISPNNFIDHILHLNYQMLEKVIHLITNLGDFDIIHGHDWLVFWASKVLKHAYTKPLIYTIHATEYGRNQGIYNDMQRYINDMEWYATFEAWKVIVCSNYMQNEVRNLFQLPDDKVQIVPNGVNPKNYISVHNAEFREKYCSPAEKMVFYVGRMVREKGVQVLLQALPAILAEEPATKLVIAGKGPNLDNLKSQAAHLGIEDRVYFTGFISDEVRNKLYSAADVAVFPSLYEPFGIVALEAMVTHTPVIVSDVGGLAEFVKHEENGLKVPPNHPHELAKLVLRIFRNQTLAESISEKGYKMVKNNYSWNHIAIKTISVYKEVLKEYEQSNWRQKQLHREEDDESVIYKYLMDRKYS